jgi:hypothetical protein
MNPARVPQAPSSSPVMERRRFIRVIGGRLLAAPLAAEAEQASFPSADLPPTEGAALPTSIPATLSLPRRAVGSVSAVVIGSSAEDNGPDGARQIRRRPRQVLETRR